MSMGGAQAVGGAGAEGLGIQKATNAVSEAIQKAAQDEDNRSQMVKNLIGKSKVSQF